MRSDAPSARTMALFSSCYRRSAGLFRLLVSVRCEHSHWPSGKTSQEVLLPVLRFVEIARWLQRAASTVSREEARHGGRPLNRASEADHQAWQSTLRPKPCLLAIHGSCGRIVASKLILDWPPEQISVWLKRRYPSNESMRVAHETIYHRLFIQARLRRSRHARAGGKSKGQIVDAISIRERPAEIEDRAIPGHWAGDLLADTSNGHIAIWWNDIRALRFW